MALGFTGAVRLGHAEANSRQLLIGIFGCNLAWAIVDGVTYVLTAHFERGRMARLARDVVAAPTEETAVARIEEHLTVRLDALATAEQRRQIAQWGSQNLRGMKLEPPGLQRTDV